MVNVMIYTAGSHSPSFNMMHSVLSVLTLAPIPWKVTLVQLYVNTIPQSFRFPKSCEISRLPCITVFAPLL